MNEYVSDIAFSPAVKEAQDRRGSRQGYAKMAEKRDWDDKVTDRIAAFIAERDSFYIATVNGAGQPTIQHRGVPKGFLKVLDEHTLAFADFRGNRQYITLGNLSENAKACLFLMDYTNAVRVKLWGEARVVEDDPELMAKLTAPDYKAQPEHAIVFTLSAFDTNCPQHIVKRFDEAVIKQVSEKLTRRIGELEAEVVRLTSALNSS